MLLGDVQLSSEMGNQGRKWREDGDFKWLFVVLFYAGIHESGGFGGYESAVPLVDGTRVNVFAWGCENILPCVLIGDIITQDMRRVVQLANLMGNQIRQTRICIDRVRRIRPKPDVGDQVFLRQDR